MTKSQSSITATNQPRIIPDPSRTIAKFLMPVEQSPKKLSLKDSPLLALSAYAPGSSLALEGLIKAHSQDPGLELRYAPIVSLGGFLLLEDKLSSGERGWSRPG
ncbi:hypothetical protein KM043_004560 [Ampulex compressa]|nr:hypothetical protein KM043_004560 [Ampulex compressa]